MTPNSDAVKAAHSAKDLAWSPKTLEVHLRDEHGIHLERRWYPITELEDLHSDAHAN